MSPSCIYSFGTVSSLHPTSFLTIFILIAFINLQGDCGRQETRKGCVPPEMKNAHVCTHRALVDKLTTLNVTVCIMEKREEVMQLLLILWHKNVSKFNHQNGVPYCLLDFTVSILSWNTRVHVMCTKSEKSQVSNRKQRSNALH